MSSLVPSKSTDLPQLASLLTDKSMSHRSMAQSSMAELSLEELQEILAIFKRNSLHEKVKTGFLYAGGALLVLGVGALLIGLAGAGEGAGCVDLGCGGSGCYTGDGCGDFGKGTKLSEQNRITEARSKVVREIIKRDNFLAIPDLYSEILQVNWDTSKLIHKSLQTLFQALEPDSKYWFRKNCQEPILASLKKIYFPSELERDSIVASIIALGKFGDGRAIPPLDKLIVNMKNPFIDDIRRAASKSAIEIAERLAKEKVGEELLRPVLDSRFDNSNLLRPAEDSGLTPTGELLRPSNLNSEKEILDDE